MREQVLCTALPACLGWAGRPYLAWGVQLHPPERLATADWPADLAHLLAPKKSQAAHHETSRRRYGRRLNDHASNTADGDPGAPETGGCASVFLDETVLRRLSCRFHHVRYPSRQLKLETEHVSNLPDEALEPQPQSQPQPQPEETTSAAWETRLVLPPKRTEALVEKEVKASDPTYVPATDIEGLEEIPALKNWWDLPGHWGEESEFRGFGGVEKVTASAMVEIYLREAVVETLVLKHTGKLQRSAGRTWYQGDTRALRRALAIGIQVRSGKLWLKGDVDSLSKMIDPCEEEAETPVEEEAKSLVEDQVKAPVEGEAESPLPVEAIAESPPPEMVSLEEARQMIEKWGLGWKNIILDDQFKFALRKRLYQLTGIHIPDSRLGAVNTVQDMLVFATRDPRPPKLADALHRQRNLQRLRNVTVHSRRVGPIDKETAIGRWKVIEEELKKRDLPVRGTMGLSGNKEKDWLTGKL
ncbi:ribosomal subunit 39S domain-containing protein [Hirsutella rhossiliensis]|uniref:Large ribosomal subunit protein mL50 n=1 Tax=Hirsutella rhossiliensis TaxID=111463 RepID=A0A9P8MUY0_9HYPO|nr:ribosomal subunit 39S domain-containing protein [Hirsutella rhossiliensis]KAH0961507.1 ribosomal subunit 39S domain-containing protein [Hirsutella rhossiliensis]